MPASEPNNQSDNLPNDSQKPDHSDSDKTKNFNNMEDFVKETIRQYLGDIEFEDLTESQEQQLYEMFCDADIFKQ